MWCPSADRCSDGMDRSRQEWLTKGCDKVFFDHNSNCSASSSPKSDDNQPTETTTRYALNQLHRKMIVYRTCRQFLIELNVIILLMLTFWRNWVMILIKISKFRTTTSIAAAATTTSAVPTSTAPTVTPNSREFDPSDSQSMIGNISYLDNISYGNIIDSCFQMTQMRVQILTYRRWSVFFSWLPSSFALLDGFSTPTGIRTHRQDNVSFGYPSMIFYIFKNINWICSGEIWKGRGNLGLKLRLLDC